MRLQGKLPVVRCGVLALGLLLSVPATPTTPGAPGGAGSDSTAAIAAEPVHGDTAAGGAARRTPDSSAATAPEAPPREDRPPLVDPPLVPPHRAGPHDIPPPACPLCTGDPGVPLRVLTVDEARAIGDAYADTNTARLARLDSLYSAGAFGPPGSGKARRQAHLAARLLTLNAYSYMIRFGTDRDTVWQADEATLRPAFDTFSDPGIVPLARLVRARMGLGHMCAQYDLSQKVRTETVIGGRHLAVRVDDIPIEGRLVRVLIMDLPTSLNDVVEVCITEHVCMDVEHYVVDGPPAPYEAYVIDHMQGLWVRKAGLHRPEAFVFWVTPRQPGRAEVPENPLVGARIYVPHLVLRLPSFLPDIGFEDLREVDLPQPILPVTYLRDKRFPPWLRSASIRGFEGWEGVGGLPPAIRLRFPDL